MDSSCKHGKAAFFGKDISFRCSHILDLLLIAVKHYNIYQKINSALLQTYNGNEIFRV